MENDEIKAMIEESKKFTKNLEELLKREEKKSRFPERYMTRYSCHVDEDMTFVASKSNFPAYKNYRDYIVTEQQKALDDFKYETFTRLMERIIKAFNTDENGKVHEVNWDDKSQLKYRMYYDYENHKIIRELNLTNKYIKSSLHCVYGLEEFTVENIVRELNKEGYTQADLEWWLKY